MWRVCELRDPACLVSVFHQKSGFASAKYAKEQDKPPNAWQNIQRYAAEKGAPAAESQNEGSQVHLTAL